MQITDSLPSARVIVRLAMYAESEGGRQSAFSDGYRPHLVVVGRSEWLGVIAVRCALPVVPGSVAETMFALLYYPAVDYSTLTPGCEFTVWEGSQIVGSGVVLSLHLPVAGD